MQKLLLIIFTSFLFKNCFSQKEKLFEKKSSYFWYDSCTKKAKKFIEDETDFKFELHPLEWAQHQLDSNLLRTDTLFDTKKEQLTVFYYNKDKSLFFEKTTSTEPKNWSKRIVVFDIVGNILLKEGYSDGGSLGYRLRRGYYGFATQFECYYFDTPLFRFNVFSKSGKILKPNIQVCECNF